MDEITSYLKYSYFCSCLNEQSTCTLQIKPEMCPLVVAGQIFCIFLRKKHSCYYWKYWLPTAACWFSWVPCVKLLSWNVYLCVLCVGVTDFRREGDELLRKLLEVELDGAAAAQQASELKRTVALLEAVSNPTTNSIVSNPTTDSVWLYVTDRCSYITMLLHSSLLSSSLLVSKPLRSPVKPESLTSHKV